MQLDNAMETATMFCVFQVRNWMRTNRVPFQKFSLTKMNYC